MAEPPGTIGEERWEQAASSGLKVTAALPLPTRCSEPETWPLQTSDFLGEVLTRNRNWRTGASETEKESQSKGVLLTWSLL